MTAAAKQKTSILGLALATVCAVGFLAGFWRPVIDGWDRRYPTREVVAALADPAVQLPVEVASGAMDSPAVREALAALPARHVRVLQRFGGRVVIAKRATLSVKPPQGELRDVVGYYVYAERTGYVAMDAGAAGETALHEVGHMLDHAAGGLSAAPDFTRVYESVRLDKKVRAKFRDQPKEFFAELFATYHFSDRSRTWLTERFPNAAQYFADLESRELPIP